MLDTGCDSVRVRVLFFSLFFKFMCISVILACGSMYHSHAWCPRRSEEGIRSHGIEVKDGSESPCMCCELLCPLQEQQMLLFLTFEPSLQPLILFSETGYYHVVQASLDLLPQIPKCSDYRYVPPTLACFLKSIIMKPQMSSR